MRLLDLSAAFPGREARRATLATRILHIRPQTRPPYDATVHTFHHSSMAGTYIDLPGHIVEHHDGHDTATWPLERVFRVPSAVVHLNRAAGSGAVTAAELRRALRGRLPRGGGLVVNALGRRRFDAIPFRSVWLASDAVRWIVRSGIRLLVSDIYESPELHGVFGAFFAAGVATVCQPVNLHRLTAPRVRLTALYAPVPGATQIPCRLVAELRGPRR